MSKYYTRVCNFYYGKISKEKVKKKLSIPLHGNNLISFDEIEIFTRKKCKRIKIKKISALKRSLKKKILIDLEKISKKKLLKDSNFLIYLF